MKKLILLSSVLFSLQLQAAPTCSDVLIGTMVSFSDLQNKTTEAVIKHYREILRVEQPIELRGFDLWHVRKVDQVKEIVVAVGTNFFRKPLDPADMPTPDYCFVTIQLTLPYVWDVQEVDCFPI